MKDGIQDKATRALYEVDYRIKEASGKHSNDQQLGIEGTGNYTSTRFKEGLVKSRKCSMIVDVDKTIGMTT